MKLHTVRPILLSLVVIWALQRNGAAPTSAPSAGLGTGTSAGLSAGPTSRPSPIQYRQLVRRDPALHLHIVEVDLADPRVVLRAVRGGIDPDGNGPWQTKIETVRNIARREKLDVAINANFFACKEAMDVMGKKVPYFTGNWATVTGWAMSDGELWSRQPAPATLVVDAKGAVSIGRFGKLPADARQVVSSLELVVNRGRNVGGAKDLAPRTAIGIDRAGKKLKLLVVDGRRDDYSVGMTGPQLGDEMMRLGCWDAMAMDGGGSSTLAMFDPIEQKMKLINQPSDGHDLAFPLSIERPVANAFGVVVKESPITQP